MYTYQSSLIADLGRQLKRGPKRLRLRQLLNIEFLLSVTERSRPYPYDFVRHALTGFRPRARGDDPVGQRLIEGETLRTDLVILAEEISEDAHIPAENWPEALYAVSELACRFGVSTKTIFRWRRRGLVGWKFHFPDRRTRLAFPDRCVRRFVAENANLVHRGSSFSQLTREEREQIVARARGLAPVGRTTVNAVARTIAAESGRAVETIRLILKHYDEAHPSGGVFNRGDLDVSGNDQRLAVWEAYQDGVTIDSLAARFGRPIAWIYQSITQMRARELKARKIECVRSDEFEAPEADATILRDPAANAPCGDAYRKPRIPAGLPPYLEQLFHVPLLSAEQERALFRQMNYLKFKADRLREALDAETAKAGELDRIEALLSEAERVKSQIVQANLRLVVSIGKRHLNAGQDFFEIVSDGNVSLMRAVDKFDYSRGFKFSTYASWAIIKNYARTIPEQRLHRERYQTGREELLDIAAGPRAEEPENDYLPTVRATVDRMLETLDERERAILRQRFGLDEALGEPQTLEQIGRRLGVSKERIRQLEARAVARLRGSFEADLARLLGT